MEEQKLTKKEAKEIEVTFKKAYGALPKKEQERFKGHAKEIYKFLEAAGKAAADEEAED